MHEPSAAMAWPGALGLVVVAVAIWFTVRMHAREGARPSSMTGLRTTRTTASPQAWVAAHRAALPGARLLAIFCLVAAAALGAVPWLGGPADEPNLATHVLYWVGFAGVVVGLVWLTRVAGRAADEVSRRPDR